MTKKRYIDDGYEAIEEQSFTDTETQKTYYVDYFDKIIDLVNNQDERIKELEKELQRCREWINSDKNDYELTLSFIKSKGFSLKDVLNYEKRKNGDVE